LRRHQQAPAVTVRTTAGQEYAIGTGTAYVTGTPAALLGWLARGLTDGLSSDGDLPHLPKGS
jgi:maleylpyruvate isomerase